MITFLPFFIFKIYIYFFSLQHYFSKKVKNKLTENGLMTILKFFPIKIKLPPVGAGPTFGTTALKKKSIKNNYSYLQIANNGGGEKRVESITEKYRLSQREYFTI